MTDTRPTPISRHAVTFIFITVLLDMVGFGIIIPVLPKLIGDVADVSLAEAAKIGGWMAAAYAIAQFAFGPLMGNLSDRFGRRPLLLLAILGLGLDFLAQAWAPTTGWLFAGRILAGLCGASWVIANACNAYHHACKIERDNHGHRGQCSAARCKMLCGLGLQAEPIDVNRTSGCVVEDSLQNLRISSGCVGNSLGLLEGFPGCFLSCAGVVDFLR